eukprot:1863689-Alexandrium_andersonii.AAC.1
MSASLVGSEMCIRDRSLSAQRPPTGRSGTSAIKAAPKLGARPWLGHLRREGDCLLYTSDAADDM